MNRQELFHGDFHLSSVSRAEKGYRGASRHFPFPFVTPMNRRSTRVERDIFTYHTLMGIHI